MSLRRPFRDSWENREYKRTGRSLSPHPEKPSWLPIRCPSPSTKPIQATSVSPPLLEPSQLHSRIPNEAIDSDSDDDDDYPEREALTPTQEACGTVKVSELLDEAKEALANQAVPAMAGEEPYASPLKTSADYPTTHYDLSSHRSNGEVTGSSSRNSSLNPEDSASQRASTLSYTSISTSSAATEFTDSTITPSVTTTDIEHAEREFLHSSFFPTHLLRPTPDFITLFAQIVPTIGDPGSGLTKFGPRSPKKAIFEDWAVIKRSKHDQDTLEQSILQEKAITGHEDNRLMWNREIVHRFKREGRSRVSTANKSKMSSTPSTVATVNSTNSGPRTRQYSVNPVLKTRHIEIDLLQRKISHGELLSLNLSNDARRDAMTIGGTPSEIGTSLLYDTGRGAGPHGLATDGSHQSDLARNHTGLSRSSDPTTSTVGTPLNKPTPSLSVFTSTSSSSTSLRPPRSRSSARHTSISSTSTSSSRRTLLSSSLLSKDKSSEYDQKERRYRAGDGHATFETGRYGMGGIMLWRIVRVAAVVGGVEHVAWWCVPEKEVGGYF